MKIDNLKWHFSRNKSEDLQGRDDDIFENKKSDQSSELLSREIVQNVLDSRYDSSKPVHLKLKYIKSPSQSAKKILKDIIGDLHTNFTKNVKGIKQEDPDTTSQSYLIIEDYNTTGLRGPYDQKAREEWRYLTGLKNQDKINEADDERLRGFDLLSWKLATGVSGKGSMEMGSRGLGKRSLHHASSFKTCLEVSKRSDDNQTILGGTCRLNELIIELNERDRSVINYSPVGFFGEYDGEWCKPLSSDESPDHKTYIENFCKSLNINRDKIGTSFVIPYLKRGEPAKIFDYMAAHWYFSIYKGDLTIEYEDEEHNQVVNKDNLLKFLESAETNLSHEADYLRFYKEIEKTTDDDAILLKESACDDRKFTKGDFKTDEEFEKFRLNVKNNSLGYLRVPIKLKSRETSKLEKSQFHVYIRRYTKADPQRNINKKSKSNKKLFRGDYFLEDALNLDGIKNRKYQVMVLIKYEDTLAFEFVRNAEDANHRELLFETSNLSSLYDRQSVDDVVTTLKHSAQSLIEALEFMDEGNDADSSAWFSIGQSKKKKKKLIKVVNPPDATKKVTVLKMLETTGKIDFVINPELTQSEIDNYFTNGVKFHINFSAESRNGEKVPFLVNITNKKYYSVNFDEKTCKLITLNKDSFIIEAMRPSFRFQFLFKEVPSLKLDIRTRTFRI